MSLLRTKNRHRSATANRKFRLIVNSNNCFYIMSMTTPATGFNK